MRSHLGVFVIGIGIALSGAVAAAHHSSALYEPTKQLTLKGTVTQWVWTNPHCFLKFDVTDDTGKVQHWGIETQNPTDMSAKGFSRLANGQILDSSNILGQ